MGTRNFYTIDILQQDSEDIASKFNDFLDPKIISDSGKATQNAETIYTRENKHIRGNIACASWNKIIEKHDLLIDLIINETAEKFCGFKADTEVKAEHFLSKIGMRLSISPTSPKPPRPVRPVKVTSPPFINTNSNR